MFYFVRLLSAIFAIKRNMKSYLFTVLTMLIFISNSHGQEFMDSEQRDGFLGDMVTSFKDEFLWEAKGKRIAENLHRKIENGEYADISDAKLFVATFTRDLFVLSNDRHLTVSLKPQSKQTQVSATNHSSPFILKEFENGIFYLKFDEFPSLSSKVETEIDQIMMRAADSQAIIIDLRDNHGGSDETVNFLAGYFFEEEVKLAYSYQWGQETQEIWTRPKVTSKSLSAVKLVILTSEATFSAGEIFAQRLQSYGKAVVIGEQTKGGAHRSATYLMNGLFLLSWPYERSEHAVTKQDIEGVGVKPQLYAHYNCAKEKAIDYLNNNGEVCLRNIHTSTLPSFLKSFLGQINSEILDQNVYQHFDSRNREEILRTLNTFKTVWNEDLNATIKNIHYMDNGNIRLVVSTGFGEVFMKLKLHNEKIKGLLFRI